MKRVTKKLARIGAIALSLIMMLSSVPVQAATNDGGESKKAPYRNVMYYGDWSIWGGQGNFYPLDIPADQLTHLNFAFLDFDSNGNLIFTDKDAATGAPVGMAGVQWGAANAGILSAMQELRAKNPNLKIGVSIGGWSKSNDFSVVAADASKRAAFVENVMKFLKYTNMDFVDLDWEYPASYREPDNVDNKNDEGTVNATPADKHNYTLLLKDLREALDKQGAEFGKTYELSVALPAPKSKLDEGIEIKELFETVDYANIMTYDMRGAWDACAGHQTGLYTNPADPFADAGLSVNDSVQYLLANGAPANKIVIGCAFYTRGWQKVTTSPVEGLPGLFGDAEKINKDADFNMTYGATNEAPMKVGESGRAGGVWSYNALDKLKTVYPGLKEYWDDTAKAPYLYNEETGAFFTYDNPRSIKEKANYVKANGLGGIISWMASQDAPTTNGKVRDELTKTIKEGLFGSAELPAQEIVSAPLDLTTTVTTYEEEWGATNKGYDITIKNNETKSESGEVLQLTELAYETVKSPKLYITTKSGATFGAGGYGCGTITNENGVGIIDLATVYDNQTIGQGASINFKLTSSAEAPTLEDIESIVLVQRILTTGEEVSRQVIYGEDAGPVDPTDPTDPVDPPVDPVDPPVDPVDPPVDPVDPPVDPVDPPVDPVDPPVDPVDPPVDPVDPPVDPVDPPVDPETPEDTYDNSKVYNGGDTVIYKGLTYKANWWTQGAAPDSSNGAWTQVVEDNADGTLAYYPGRIFNSGDKVTYEGVTYQANWWTNTVPGSDGSWKVVD